MGQLKKVRFEKSFLHKDFGLRNIFVLKNHHYFVENGRTVGGEAPKEMIRVYEYGKTRKVNRRKWTLYIAKTGHKWYPNESITEYLLNCLGESMGLQMAQSRLVIAGGQVRFLSEYFLKKDEELVHGADIYAGYMNDRDFVEEIEQKQLSRDFFTVQLTKDALDTIFPSQAAKDMFFDFVKMLLFDAFVGNNDRHFYNWGIVRELTEKTTPSFAPVYDTARGLLWNISEDKIVSLYDAPAQIKTFIKKYADASKPKIGWEGQSFINHFNLVELFFKHEYGISKGEIHDFFSTERLNKCLQTIDTKCAGLFSPQRLQLVRQCLIFRHQKIINLLSI